VNLFKTILLVKKLGKTPLNISYGMPARWDSANDEEWQEYIKIRSKIPGWLDKILIKLNIL